jgi:outer membrane protein TolC
MLQRRLAITAATDPAQAEQAHANLVDLRLRAEQLREQYIDLWNRENHPSNIARPLAGFDALIETLPQQ